MLFQGFLGTAVREVSGKQDEKLRIRELYRKIYCFHVFLVA